MKKQRGVKSIIKGQKITSNRYGSFEPKIVVRVDSEHVEMFSDVFDTKPLRTLPDHADFSIQLKSTQRGDDETLMYMLYYMLPDLSFATHRWYITGKPWMTFLQ